MKYKKRIADTLLNYKLEAFGATLIVGPKGCGKTTTAKQKAKSILELQDEDLREGYLEVAALQPSRLLQGKTPRLIDEWQDAPKIWGAVRKAVDDKQENGLYILTGSTAQMAYVPHTGTMRISRLNMLPMSLFESEESNGSISLRELFDNPNKFTGCESDLDMDGLIFAICRGGWPRAVQNNTHRTQLAIAKDLFVQTCEVDLSHVDGIKRNPEFARSILRSYSRNICTLAETKTIIADVRVANAIDDSTYHSYHEALQKLFIIDDITAWCPAIRSKTAMRASKKRNLIDPSIAVAALGLSPKYFDTDFQTLGFLFESLCFRDLKVYSSLCGGVLSYYRDRHGLEADCVLHLEDGRYALIEFKLGDNGVKEAVQHLSKLEELIVKANSKAGQRPMPLPTLKLVITGGQYGYRKEEGVFVIPIGCLRD